MLTERCTAVAARHSVDRYLERSVRAEDAAVSAVPSASAVSLQPLLCSARQCPSTRRGLMLYRDGTHLSVDGALTLTGEFKRLIRSRASA